jgi:hypothetical protein
MPIAQRLTGTKEMRNRGLDLDESWVNIFVLLRQYQLIATHWCSECITTGSDTTTDTSINDITTFIMILYYWYYSCNSNIGCSGGSSGGVPDLDTTTTALYRPAVVLLILQQVLWLIPPLIYQY